MNWKKLFDKQILERGYDYYRSGSVELTSVTDEYVEAFVSGTEEYETKVYFNNGEVLDMDCDCPYADGGNYCKHMAAVLYAHDNGDTVHEATRPDKLLKNATAEECREFLMKAIFHNSELKEKFVRFLQLRNESANTDDYRSHLEMLILQYSDNDFINWHNTVDFIGEAVGLLDECIDKLMEEKRCFDAFEMVRYYYFKIMNTEMDDDGDKYYFHEECLDKLQKIAKSSDPDTKRRLFEVSLEMLSPKFDDIFGMFLKFIRSSFDERGYLIKMLEYTDGMLVKKIGDHEKIEWVMYRIELMDKLNYPDDELMEFCRKYWNAADVRQYMTDRYIAKGSIEKAVQLLEESLKLCKKERFTAEKIHFKLKDLYKLSGDKAKYIRELWELLTKHSLRSKEIYLEFKALFEPDEWEDSREKLYSAMKYQSMLPEYFLEEKMIDRLASYVFTNKDNYLAEKYEAFLVKDYSENILAMYADHLNEAAKNTADRSTYASWAEKLRHMKKIKGGKEYVSTIIENWQTLYKNRPAMMQEISGIADE